VFADGGLLVLTVGLGGCVAAVVLFGGCFATGVAWQMACRCGRAFRWMLRHRLMLCASSPLASLATVHPLCRFNSSGGLGSSGSLECPPHIACCCSCYHCVFSLVCTFFQCFSIVSPLYSCVGQTLFGRIKIVSVTAFFLMKNVFRHGHEKEGF